MTEEQLRKLPAYAIKEIEQLRFEVKNTKALYKQACDNRTFEGSRVSLMTHMEKIPVNNGPYRFQLGADSADWVEVRIEKDFRGTSLALYAGDPLLIEPKVANAILIRLPRLTEIK